jgi:hypothetical protein
VLFGDHRVVELVVLVIELDDRARQLRAFLDAEARRERAGGDVAHTTSSGMISTSRISCSRMFRRLDEMRRHADLVQLLEDELRDAVVEHALAVEDRVFFRVERGGVVLEVLDQRAGLGAFVEDLGLAFVNAAAAAHFDPI